MSWGVTSALGVTHNGMGGSGGVWCIVVTGSPGMLPGVVIGRV